MSRTRASLRRTPAAAVHRTPVHTAAQRLQSTVGASGVRRMIQRAVAKAAAGDEQEREAERVTTSGLSLASTSAGARPASDEEDGSRPASRLGSAGSPSHTLSAPVHKSRATQPIAFRHVGLLQRKCACGGEAGPTGECAECQKKRLNAEAPLVQTRLTVNQPGDEYEQEADRVADMVMRMAGPERVDATPEPMVGLHAASDMALPSGGVPLASSERRFFEPRLGHQFSQVRIHSDGRAGSLARSLNARAFTAGRDIVFGAGEYAPSTTSGRRLLAHELTHVVQQGRAGATPAGARAPATLRSPPAIQRACKPAGIGTQTGCTTPPDSGFFRRGNGRIYQFNVNCDTFAGSHAADLATDGKALATGSTVDVHGFASTDGDAIFNENLACARAKAAKKVLTDPVAAGGAGMPASDILIDSHGPTPGPSADRRSVTIETSGPPPPPPRTRPPSRTLPTGPFLDLQIACVSDGGGCAPGANIAALDTQCRTTTPYRGTPLVLADLVCGTPGLGIAQSLDRSYPTWRTVIPDCPCTRADADADPDFSRDRNPFLGRFHPGADTCFRSDPVASVPNTAHRQQCCYLRSGILITQGAGQGTPDVWDPFFRHQRIDVTPFTQLGSATYNRFWIPNHGSGCGPAGDPCINRCAQIFEECGDGARCLAVRSACLRRCP